MFRFGVSYSLLRLVSSTYMGPSSRDLVSCIVCRVSSISSLFFALFVRTVSGHVLNICDEFPRVHFGA